MLPLVEVPEIVRHYAPFFASVFSPEAFTQFQRYVSGLIVAENKPVDGINRIFGSDVRHQRSLNRGFTESPFSVEAVNQARVELLSSRAGTPMKPKGVLSIDDTLLTHAGQQCDKSAYLAASTQGGYVWAHNWVNLPYRDDQTDDPVDFRLWEPVGVHDLDAGLQAAGVQIRASTYPLKASAPHKWRQYRLGLWRRPQHKPAGQQLYHRKLRLAPEMLTQFCSRHAARHLPVTVDNWYTQPAFCRFWEKTLQVADVGTLAGTAQVNRATEAQAFAAVEQHWHQEHHDALTPGHQPVFHQITIAYKGDQETSYSYGQTPRIHNFGKPRVVVNHRKADLSDPAMFCLSNKLHGQAQGSTRIRRHRWPVEV